MKSKIIKVLILVFVFSLFFRISPTANASENGIKLLTLNLLFSKPTTSPDSAGDERFDSIAEFINDPDQGIDCVLCQEVVGGN